MLLRSRIGAIAIAILVTATGGSAVFGSSNSGSSSQPKRVALSKFAGTWTGPIVQTGFPDGSFKSVLDTSGNGTVDIIELQCKGTETFISFDGTTLKLRHVVTIDPLSHCVKQGTVTATLTGSNTSTWNFLGDDGTISIGTGTRAKKQGADHSCDRATKRIMSLAKHQAATTNQIAKQNLKLTSLIAARARAVADARPALIASADKRIATLEASINAKSDSLSQGSEAIRLASTHCGFTPPPAPSQIQCPDGTAHDAPFECASAPPAANRVASAAATAVSVGTTNVQPDSYSCGQSSFIDFEEFADGTNLSTRSFPGVHFTTTQNTDWIVGDFALAGRYNGKYPNGTSPGGGYTSRGTHWAWLGVAQGAGKIELTRPASHFSLLVSSVTPVVLEAYAADGTLLGTAGPTSNNVGTGTMDELSVSTDTPQISSLIIHDSGNFFLVDAVCTDAAGATIRNDPRNVPPGFALDSDYWQWPDADQDGIPDFWEENGVWVSNKFLDLPALDANVNHKDLFIWVDAVDPAYADNGVRELMRKAFDASPLANPTGANPTGKKGVSVHYHIGELSLSKATYGSASSDADVINVLNRAASKSGYSKDAGAGDQSVPPIFKYLFFGEKIPNGVTGRALGIPGVAAMVAVGDTVLDDMGNLVWRTGRFWPGESRAFVRAVVASHELGHLLGLWHHGNKDKPVEDRSYKSVMSYSYSTIGLDSTFGLPPGFFRTANTIDYARTGSVEPDSAPPDTNLDWRVGVGNGALTFLPGQFGQGANNYYLQWHPGELRQTDGPAESEVSLAEQIALADPDSLQNFVQAFEGTSVNHPPVPFAGGRYSGNEGSVIAMSSATASDPDVADVMSYAWTVNSSLCSFDNPIALTPNLTCTDDGDFTATLTATDGIAAAQSQATVTVANVAPSVDIAGAIGIDEGATYGLVLGTVTDPGADTVSGYVVHWGDGTSDSYTTAGAKPHAYLDGPLTAGVTVDLVDEDGTFLNRANPLTVTVANVAPVAGLVRVSASLVAVNTAISATAPFTDRGSHDTHTAVWDWGDLTTSPGSITEAGGSGTATATHLFTVPGVYPILVTIRDNDGGVSDQAVYLYVVVYDPSAGFVTGSGKFNSPVGALPARPTATGRAEFGFSAGYNKSGRLVSESEFELEFGDFEFHSDNAQWLVISGATGQLQGTGTVEGSTHQFGYLITVTDGQVPQGGGIDRIRLQVWDDDNSGAVVYDNEPASPRYAAAATPIAKGQVKLKAPRMRPSPRRRIPHKFS